MKNKTDSNEFEASIKAGWYRKELSFQVELELHLEPSKKEFNSHGST